MAINRNGPGAYVQVNDASDYVPAGNSVAAAIVGFASRGPTNEAILISDSERAETVFGNPTRYTGGQGLLALHELLNLTNRVYYIRCVSPMANPAVANIQLGTSPMAGVSGLSSTAHAFFINAYSAGSLLNSEPFFISTPSGTDQIGKIKTAVDSYLPETAAFTYVSSTASLGFFVGNYAGSGITLQVTGYAGNTIPYFSAIGGDGYAAGGGGRGVEGSLGLLSLPTHAQILAQASSGYFKQTALGTERLFGTPGVDYTMVTDESNWLTNAGVYAGQMGSSIATSGNTLTPNGVSGGVINLESLHPGAGYNLITSSTSDGYKTYGLQAVVTPLVGKDSRIDLYSDGGVKESYIASFVDDTSGGSNYVFDKINTEPYTGEPTSEYAYGRLAAVDGSSEYSATPVTTAPTTFGGTFLGQAAFTQEAGVRQTLRFAKIIQGTYNFAGGVNGDVADEGGSVSDSDILNAVIGSPAARSGMQALNDSNLDVRVAIVPGFTSQTIQNELATIAATTGRFAAMFGPPEGLPSEQRAVAWMNGLGDGRSAAVNNLYADVYWPWVQAFDRFAGVERYFDPAIFGAFAQLNTAIRKNEWAAPAGLEVGRLTRATDTEIKVAPNGGTLYEANINPIMKFDTDGIVVWGQKTSQRASTALDRINVRNGLISLTKTLLRLGRQFAFKPNDPITWAQVVGVITPYLADIKDKRGIRKFSVICDESVNTSARVDRGELWCRIIVTPTKTAEEIIFEVNFTNQTGKIIL